MRGLPRPRERSLSDQHKSLVFNKIAASEGASHGPETGLSSATAFPVVAARELKLLF